MKLWIDGQCLQTASRLRGIGRYVQDLIGAIAQHQPSVELLISFNASMLDASISASDMVSRWIDRRNIHVWHGANSLGELDGQHAERSLSEIALSHHVAQLAPDIALSTSPFEGEHDAAVPLVKNSVLECPIAAIFYDAIPYRFPDRYLPTKDALGRYAARLNSYKSFDLNLCISHFSQAELQRIVGDTRAVNIDAAVSERLLAMIDDKQTSVARDSDFVLYVGALDWRKNVISLVDAIKIRRERGSPPIKLVIAGDPDPTRVDMVVKHWNNSSLTANDLVIAGLVSDANLVGLYKRAALVVQPSRMEGFGLSVLEAMACGAPVIGANAGAVAEVIGDTTLLFDPESPQEIAERMDTILFDPMSTARASAAGWRRAQQYSWSRTAGIAVSAMKEVVAERTQRGSAPAARQRALGAAIALTVDTSVVVETLARSEPLSDRPGRFIIDATETMLHDRRTGIQRVVQNTAIAAAASSAAEHTRIGYSDKDEVWYSYAPRRAGLPPIEKTAAARHTFYRNDTLLMLDSSWLHHAGVQSRLVGLRARGVKIISCLYDTVPLKYPGFCDDGMPPAFARWFESALRYSSGFVCISEAVADELHSLLEAIEFPRKMAVGHWRLGANFAGPSSLSHVPERSQPASFLMVGTIEPRKGHRVALDAFEELWRNGKNVRLTIVGKVGWGTQGLATRLRNHPEAGSRLLWIDDADDRVLQRLYRECSALLATSYAEGFGLPLVEARHFGKAVVASDLPVFREVGVGASNFRYFDAGSPSSLAFVIDDFLRTYVEIPQADGSPDHSWPNWSESFEELYRLIVADRWQATYHPSSENPFPSLSDMGRVTMKEPLRADDRRCKIELIERVGEDRLERVIVRVGNLSSVPWSSRSASENQLGGVLLACTPLDRNGHRISRGIQRKAIPFVVQPHDSIVMSVDPRRDRYWASATDMVLEIEQVGTGIFGVGLQVSLKNSQRGNT